MVSTRGVKFKFSEGEKVLCYEPDPSKAKVLYDSKVLEIVQKGRKSVEYLIHFQGWNSSWDRCVPEEYVLRDTEENRQLQKRLAEKAQLQLGVFFYRKDRGRQRQNKHLSEFGKRRLDSSDSDDMMDDDLNFDMLEDVVDEDETDDPLLDGDLDDAGEEADDDQGSTADETDEDDDDNFDLDCNEENKENKQTVKQYDHHHAPLDIPKDIKMFLNRDYEGINFKKKRVRLPASPNILTILETYVRDYSRELLTADDEPKIEDEQDPKLSYAGAYKSSLNPQRSQRQRKRQRRISSTSSCDGEESDKEFQEILRNLRICKEVMHSLRYYIDFLLGDQLLYACEKIQYKDVKRMIKFGHFGEMRKKYNPRDFIPMQQRILAKIDSDSEEQGKSDTEAELLEMISAVDEGFAQRWNDLLRDAGCEIEETEVIKTEPEEILEDTDSQDQANCLEPSYNLSSGAGCSKSPDKGAASRCTRSAEAGTSAPVVMTPRMERRRSLLETMMKYKVVPEESLNPKKPTMSCLYGAVHLLRLLVKMPDFLFATKLPEGHVKAIQRHLNLFLAYLAKQPTYLDQNQYFTHYFCHMESDVEDEDLSNFY